MTQHQRILKYIRDQGSITTFEAFSNLGVTYLASRMSELSKQGFDVKKEVVEGTNRYGEKVRYIRYRVEEEVIAI